MRIALAGNPNCGKTSTFNFLTGKLEKVGNWSGVTVEKKVSKLKKKYSNEDVMIIDLPGVYSLDVYTDEELVTKRALEDSSIDAVINIVDALNLERGLELTLQLLKFNKPTVVALNKSDLASKKNISINVERLSEVLGVPVLMYSANRRTGLAEVVEKAIELARK